LNGFQNAPRHFSSFVLVQDAMADEIILETRGLIKEFKGFVAVNDVNLKVRS
jgi:ABC-type uncharacterized transport system ATPase subunit